VWVFVSGIVFVFPPCAAQLVFALRFHKKTPLNQNPYSSLQHSPFLVGLCVVLTLGVANLFYMHTQLSLFSPLHEPFTHPVPDLTKPYRLFPPSGLISFPPQPSPLENTSPSPTPSSLLTSSPKTDPENDLPPVIYKTDSFFLIL